MIELRVRGKRAVENYNSFICQGFVFTGGS